MKKIWYKIKDFFKNTTRRIIAVVLAMALLSTTLFNVIYYSIIKNSSKPAGNQQDQTQSQAKEQNVETDKTGTAQPEKVSVGEKFVFTDEMSELTNISENAKTEKRVKEAVDKLNEGEFETAVASLTQCIEEEENNYALYYIRGKFYETKEETYDLAISDYKKSISLKADFINTYVSLSKIYYVTKQYDSVVSVCNDGLTIKKDQVELVELRMYSFNQNNDNQNAIKDAKKLIQLQPKSPIGYAALADFLIVNSKYDDAITNYTTALKYCDKSTETLRYMVYRQRALCYYNTSKYKEAISDFAEYYKKYSEDFNILYFAISCFTTQDYENAIVWFEKCIDKSYEVNTTAYYLASAYAAKKNYKDALTYYTMCIDNEYSLDNCLYNRGICYKELGDKESAKKDLQECIRLTADSALEKSANEALQQLKITIITNNSSK